MKDHIMRYLLTTALSILPFAAVAEVPRVVTDLPPVYGLVASVMGDLGTPELLLDKGAGAHDFQLRPSQMGAIAEADITIWVGPEMTPWLERALAGGKADMVSLTLLDVAGTYVREFGAPAIESHDAHGDEKGHDEKGHDDHAKEGDAHAEHDHGKGHDDHAAEKGHDEAGHKEGHEDHASKEEGHDDHGHDGIDPHAWLDPGNAAPWLDAIAATLSARDAANAATYAANAAAAKAEIAALDLELAALLAPAKDKGFVAYHDAYQYFTSHYGLNYLGAIAFGDATHAGAAHLRNMQDQIKQNVVCVFPERQHDSALLLQLTEGSTAKAGSPLDPEGAMIDPSRSSYRDVLRNLATSMAQCLSGA